MDISLQNHIQSVNSISCQKQTLTALKNKHECNKLDLLRKFLFTKYNFQDEIKDNPDFEAERLAKEISRELKNIDYDTFETILNKNKNQVLYEYYENCENTKLSDDYSPSEFEYSKTITNNNFKVFITPDNFKKYILTTSDNFEKIYFKKCNVYGLELIKITILNKNFYSLYINSINKIMTKIIDLLIDEYHIKYTSNTISSIKSSGYLDGNIYETTHTIELHEINLNDILKNINLKDIDCTIPLHNKCTEINLQSPTIKTKVRSGFEDDW